MLRHRGLRELRLEPHVLVLSAGPAVFRRWEPAGSRGPPEAPQEPGSIAPLKFPAALAATVILIFVSAAASPQWRFRRDIFRAARRRAALDPKGRAALGLVAFGIACGIPASLGFIEGNVLLILGALASCMIGRALARPAGYSFNSAWSWFAVIGLSVTAGFLLASGDVGITRAMAAQSAAGSALLASSATAAGAAAAGLAAGLIGAVAWASKLPALAPSEETAAVAAMLRWGETALAGAAVSGVAAGPSLGALVFLPDGAGFAAGPLISFAITCLVVAMVSTGRRYSAALARTPVLIACALAAAAAAAAPGFVR